MNNYIIFTVARSGKSWIAETLYWLGLGYGLELLTEFARNAAPGQNLLRAAYDRDGMAGLARAFVDVDSKKGYPCTGITLQWINLDLIAADRRPNELRSFIETLQPCVLLFLRRRDVLSQAISHFIMMRSGYIHSTDRQDGQRQRTEISYDRSGIEEYLVFTERSYAGWTNLFAASGIDPTVLYYEDFVRNPIRSFGDLAERIAEHRFDDEMIAAAAGCQSKIADATDEMFRRLYLAGR